MTPSPSDQDILMLWITNLNDEAQVTADSITIGDRRLVFDTVGALARVEHLNPTGQVIGKVLA